MLGVEQNNGIRIWLALEHDGLGNGGFWPLGMIVWSAVIIGAVALIVWALRAVSSPSHYEGTRHSSVLDVLDERYARGEINHDEYLQKKNEILRR